MASESAAVIVISSSSSSSSEDSEEVLERIQMCKLREKYRLFTCRRREETDGEEEDDDCVILEEKPFREEAWEEAKTIVDFSNKLSLSGGGDLDRKDGFLQQQQGEGEGEGEEENEVSILAERGTVALRDYPHSRHLCARLPFSKTPHEDYCDKCYCYVCDKPAPCGQWREIPRGHCNATDQDDAWRKLRRACRLGGSSQTIGSQTVNT